MLPQTVFTPAIPMVGADNSGRLLEGVEKWCKKTVHMFKACPLTPPALISIILIRKGNTRVIPWVPRCAIVIIRNMSFRYVEKDKNGVAWPH